MNQTNSASREGVRHFAFISYSHIAGGKLAPAIESALQKFGKPLFAHANIEVFRDETGLALTPDLWGEIQQSLEKADSFILVACPQAAKSEWVQQEIRYWLEHKSVERMFIVRADGEISWANGDFDWTKTTALPRVLSGRFKNVPLWADFTWAKADSDLSLNQPMFAREIAQLIAGIRQKPIKEIFDEAAAETERTKKIFKRSVVALALLAVISILLALVSLETKRKTDKLAAAQSAADAEKAATLKTQQAQTAEAATRARNVAASIALAGKAAEALPVDRELSRRLALEATEIAPTSEATEALRATVLDVSSPLKLHGHYGLVTSARFSGDGKFLLTSGDDGTVRLWDANSGTNFTTVSLAADPSRGDHARGVLSANGSRLLTMACPESIAFGFWTNATPLCVYEAATGKKLATIMDEFAVSAAFSPDGKRIATADFNSSAKVWDAANGTLLFELRGHGQRVSTVQFSEDGRQILTACWDGSARIWEAQTGRPLATLPAQKMLDHAVFSGDGTHVLTLGGEKAEQGRTLQLWDWVKSPGGSIAEFDGGENGFSVFDLSRDGKNIFTASGTEAKIWSADGKCLHVLSGHTESIADFSASPDDRWLATVGVDGSTRLWDIQTGKILVQLEGEKSERTCVAFSPDGKRLATGGSDGRICIFECRFCGDLADLKVLARSLPTRELTAEERKIYLQSVSEK